MPLLGCEDLDDELGVDVCWRLRAEGMGGDGGNVWVCVLMRDCEDIACSRSEECFVALDRIFCCEACLKRKEKRGNRERRAR